MVLRKKSPEEALSAEESQAAVHVCWVLNGKLEVNTCPAAAARVHCKVQCVARGLDYKIL